MCERRQPLHSHELPYLQSILPFWSDVAEQAKMPENELVEWRKLKVGSLDDILNHPDFYWREPYGVIVGQVPEINA